MTGATLSEADSRALVATFGVTVSPYVTGTTVDEVVTAAADLKYPVVAKLCGPSIAHKTERGLVALGLGSPEALAEAARRLLDAATPDDGDVSVLASSMIHGNRELIAGVTRDPQFGPVVMLGVGGILAEAVRDVAFRMVPVTPVDADELIDDLRTVALLGPFRGEPAIDRRALVSTLVGLSDLVNQRADISSVDCNPLVVCDGLPIAVDALVELDRPS